jgi:hypothetical protein
MTLRQSFHQNATSAGSDEEGAQRDKRSNHRQPATARDPETQQDHVAGHVRREHPAER